MCVFVFKMCWAGVFLKSRDKKRLNVIACWKVWWGDGARVRTQAFTLMIELLFPSGIFTVCCVACIWLACGVVVCWCVGMMWVMCDVSDVWCKFLSWHAVLTLLKALGCPMLENMSRVSSQESMVSEYKYVACYNQKLKVNNQILLLLRW